MSQENVAVVRRLYERVPDLADPATTEAVVAELFDPAVHLDLTRRVFNPASYDGHEGVLRSLGEIREIWERFLVRPERFIDAGDEVLVIETVEGRGRTAGVEVVGRSASLYALKHGRVVRLVVYESPSEGLEALGLRE
jgi:ketosteroid isomerase-like protein